MKWKVQILTLMMRMVVSVTIEGFDVENFGFPHAHFQSPYSNFQNE
ncbi:hypothetical protein CK203_013287 [Vitis vinifera]|uniref:Uncharacterized protein n=1 Tax=Vitis vinifera TaxID=29760 RepID=A0A438JPT9_VITVI|nr:hypothetical protein CK203_013287 [Vitis vinifera]